MRQVGIFGKRKSGKSALLHALRKTDMMGGTNFSAMEIAGVGKIMLVDTVGVDAPDSTAERSAASIEVALMLIANESFELELAWLSKLRKLGTKIIVVISQSDKFSDGGKNLAAAVSEVSGLETICVSAKDGSGIEELHSKIIEILSHLKR